MPGEPDSPDTVSFIRTLPEAESFELLDAAVVGRVGFVAMPLLLSTSECMGIPIGWSSRPTSPDSRSSARVRLLMHPGILKIIVPPKTPTGLSTTMVGTEIPHRHQVLTQRV
jgi:hypothetical protein